MLEDGNPVAPAILFILAAWRDRRETILPVLQRLDLRSARIAVSDLEGFAELTHLLREVSARISRRGVEVASEFELTPMAVNALWYAGIGDTAPSMRELALRVRADPSRMTAVADELEARGLLERQTDPNNRRVKLLVLTPAGAKLRRSLVRARVRRVADRAALAGRPGQALRRARASARRVQLVRAAASRSIAGGRGRVVRAATLGRRSIPVGKPHDAVCKEVPAVQPRRQGLRPPGDGEAGVG